jgi:predicted hydrocarbon binding protein
MSSSNTNREAGLLAVAVAVVTALVAAGIGVVPQIHRTWAIVLAVGVLGAAVLGLVIYIARSAHNILAGQPHDTAIVRYEDDRETGILLKGDIENVSLRVSTLHFIVDALVVAIPEASRQAALYGCGREVGRAWVADFRRQLRRLPIDTDDILRQLLQWSEYDATAGMGRLTVAVDPTSGEGLVMLANGFLSRAPATFPLDWWFAGYLAGTLRELLDREVDVEVTDPSVARSKATFFRVTPAT